MGEQYENNRVWKNSLGKEANAEKEKKALGQLTASYVSTRGNARILAEEIGSSLPFFTAHDLTHIDALWDAADTLLYGNQDDGYHYSLNPAEGYVLGLAFLLHDLGMGLAAYTEGLTGLQMNHYFQDAIADEFWKEKGHAISKDDWNVIAEELSKSKSLYDLQPFLRRALQITLRDIHADKAEILGTVRWDGSSGEIYLIHDDYLRASYGKMAGEIAASHGWDCDTLKERFQNDPVGAPGRMPREWTIDRAKLACILRTADAMQIDDRRAPAFLMTARQPEGVSRLHYIFQNKINQPDINEERLHFSSNSAFSLQEMDAWWLCYDTLRMVDRELRNVDTFLMETGRQRFQARGVYGLSSPRELSRDIQVDGWIPMDTAIHVGNVGKLVSTLGGKQLYGENNNWVPFRELIQNGADAIRARRLQTKNWKDTDGDLTISLYNEGNDHYISFTDTGIGMSEEVLTGPFLDFGQSFWNTNMMHKEWPGLAAKGFQSTGKYGIGFYSVFMWSNDVKVITRKYKGDGCERTLTLEFRNGVYCRPVLRNATKEEQEQVERGGTSVIIKISEDLMKSIESGAIFHNYRSGYSGRYYYYLEDNFSRGYRGYYYDEAFLREESLQDSILFYFPCLDCNLWLNTSESRQQLSQADDWESMDPLLLIRRMIGPNRYSRIKKKTLKQITAAAEKMELIVENGNIVGRASLDTHNLSFGCIVIGGCREHRINYINGIMLGKSSKADRSRSVPVMNKESMQMWLKSQAGKMYQGKYSASAGKKVSGIILSYDIEDYNDKSSIAMYNGAILRYQDIVKRTVNSSSDVFLIMRTIAYSSNVYFKQMRRIYAEWNCKTHKIYKRIKRFNKKICFYFTENYTIEWAHSHHYRNELEMHDTVRIIKKAILEGLRIPPDKENLHVFTINEIDSIDEACPLRDIFIDLKKLLLKDNKYFLRYSDIAAIITREEICWKG